MHFLRSETMTPAKPVYGIVECQSTASLNLESCQTNFAPLFHCARISSFLMSLRITPTASVSSCHMPISLYYHKGCPALSVPQHCSGHRLVKLIWISQKGERQELKDYDTGVENKQ